MNTSQTKLANTKSQPALDQIDGRLLTELANSKLLHDLSTQLIHQDKPGGLYERILDAAITIMHSRFASLQIFCREKGNEGELQLIGFRGFSPKAAKFWEWVRIDSGSSCGAALREGKRVVVPDTEQCDFMVGSDDLAAYAETGIRAVQSTPLLSRSGNFVGMLSTHWDVPHVPAESALRFLDILARQAADLIERTRNQAELEIKVKERTAEIARAQQDLQALSSRILQIQDEERRRLARELHDSAGQMLAVLNLQLDQTAQLVKKVNPRLAENIESSRALVQRLVQGIRTTSYLLHPPLLDEQGLSSALGWYVDGIRQRSGMERNSSIRTP